MFIKKMRVNWTLRIIASTILCLAIVVSCLFASDISVMAASDLRIQGPNQFFEANPLMLYSAQTDSSEADHEIWTQNCTVTATGNQEVYNNLHGREGDTPRDVLFLSGWTTKAEWISGYNPINAGSYSFVAVNDYASNPTLTVDYPFVGTYKGEKIGCTLVVSDIVYEDTVATGWVLPWDGLNADPSVPYFAFTSNLYNGFSNYNTKRCTMTYHFYDYDTKQEIPLDAGCFLSVNSLNGGNNPETWVEPFCEWVGVNGADYAMVVPENNLLDLSSGSGFDIKVGGGEGYVDDYIGSPTFSRNSTTIVYEDYTVPRLTFGADGRALSGETRNCIWATVVTSALSLNIPASPYKDVSSSNVYANDTVMYSVHQVVNKLGEDCVTSHYIDMTMKDIMPDNFNYQSVKVVDMSNNSDITSSWNASYDSNTRSLSCAAKPDYLSNTTLNGQTIRFDITGKMDGTLTDEKVTENTAVTMFNTTDASGGITLKSNTVNVEHHVPTLAVDKVSDKTAYGVGETAKYTITASNPGPSNDDVARGIVISDQLSDIKAKIDTSSIKVANNNGYDITSQCSINATESNFTIQTGQDLTYNQKITVTYNVTLGESFNAGASLTNNVKVTSSNANSVNDSVTVSLMDKTISITKKVKANEVLFANGNPTFVFKLEGTSILGTPISKYQSVEFTSADALNVDAQGYMSKTISFDHLFSGNYQVSEVRSVRYDLDSITDLSTGASINGEAVNYDLVAAMGGNATFINKQTNYLKTSHNDIVSNKISG